MVRHGTGLTVRAEGFWGVKMAPCSCNPVPVPVGLGNPPNPITQTICLSCSNYKPSSLKANRQRGAIMMETFITIYHNSNEIKKCIYVTGCQRQRVAKQPGSYYFTLIQGLLGMGTCTC